MKTPEAKIANILRKKIKELGLVGNVTKRLDFVSVSVDNGDDQKFAELKELAKTFQIGQFDGMDDSYTITNRDDSIPQVGYVIVQNFKEAA